jgi:hypothetical protein
VLGCNEYKLYRRIADGSYKLVYTGSGNQYRDSLTEGSGIYEYAVSASNGNGESALCHAVTTDPDSWLNFEPVKGEPFRRTVTIESSVDNDGNKMSSSYYPE